MLLNMLRQWHTLALIVVSLTGLGATSPTQAAQNLPKVQPVMSCANISTLDFSHDNISADVKLLPQMN